MYKVIPEEVLKMTALSELSGMSCAIDISIFLYKTIRSCGVYGWENQFIYLICVLVKNKISCVCVFDGKNPPIEKKREQQSRRETVKKQVDKLERCKVIKDTLEKGMSEPLYEPPEQIIKECQEITGKYHTSASNIIGELVNTIAKLTNQTIPITDEYKEKAKEILNMLDVKVVQADGEAEGLCASMARDGFVDFVLSEDTDVLVYGARRLCAFKKFKFSDEMVYAIDLAEILTRMEMTFESFVDLCILLSCDYNVRVKGWIPSAKKQKKAVAIGAKKALEMIEEYGDLDSMKDFIEQFEDLNHERCREIFKGVEYTTDMIPNMTPPNPNLEMISDYLQNNESMTLSIDYIGRCFGFNVPRKSVLG